MPTLEIWCQLGGDPAVIKAEIALTGVKLPCSGEGIQRSSDTICSPCQYCS